MALPPERITVKRRRDEDPVEALYIQSKKQRPGILWKLQNLPTEKHQYVHGLSPEATGENPNKPTSYGTASSVLPGSTKNGQGRVDDDPSLAEPRGPLIQINSSNEDAKSESPHADCDTSLSSRTKTSKTSTFRQYHLTPQSHPTLKRQPSFIHGVKKRQRSQRDRLAIFVESERAEALIERTIRERFETRPKKIEQDNQQAQDPRPQIGAGSTLRKRPNVSAAERTWRSETWGNQNVVSVNMDPENASKPTTSWDAESMNIAQELQNFALEHTRAASEAPEASKKNESKFQPKPPRPRQKAETVSVPQSHGNIDEEGDCIFDTYVRAPVQVSVLDTPSGTFVDPLDNMDMNKVGILVIEEDQETLWEEFGDEYQSEEEFESDEEDENAEDFYGNDYPEEELDSDDEYGRGSYNHRKYASDEEEYGDDEPQWSDAEHPS